MHGVAGLVVPVLTAEKVPSRRAEGVLATTKKPPPRRRRWVPGTGAGAVRLLAEHADSWSLLLERLDSRRTLEVLPDPECRDRVGGRAPPASPCRLSTRHSDAGGAG